MRRILVIDDQLLEEAQQALGTRGVRDTVEASLKEAIRRHRLDKLRRSLGNMGLDMTHEELIRLRRNT